MDQTFIEGAVLISFYIIGVIGLIVAGELISRFYERISRELVKKLSVRASYSRAAGRQRAFPCCSYNTLSSRFRV